MDIKRLDENTVVFSDLDYFFYELLRQIPLAALVEEGDAAHARLYPSPSDKGDERMEEEWEEFVTPELKELFQSSLETVRQDLETIPSGQAQYLRDLHVPVSHLSAWINALNQARLALAARHGISEREIEGVLTENHIRTLAIFQIDFYGMVQERLMRELDGV